MTTSGKNLRRTRSGIGEDFPLHFHRRGLYHRFRFFNLESLETTPALFISCFVLGALAFFQALLAAGAPWGHFAWGGQHRILPVRLRIGSLVSIVLYLAFMIILGNRVGLLSWVPERPAQILAWALVAYFALGVLMNAISRSRAERLTMTPVAALLFACSFAIATA